MDNNESIEIAEQKQGVAGVFGRAALTYDHVGPLFSHFGRRLVELAAIPGGVSPWVEDLYYFRLPVWLARRVKYRN